MVYPRSFIDRVYDRLYGYYEQNAENADSVVVRRRRRVHRGVHAENDELDDADYVRRIRVYLFGGVLGIYDYKLASLYGIDFAYQFYSREVVQEKSGKTRERENRKSQIRKVEIKGI